MTRLAMLLDVTRVRALAVPTASGEANVVLEVPWTASQPATAVRQLQATVGSSNSIALVVGMGWLEIARPELPPLAAMARQQLLTRDADRYFPVAGRAAVSYVDGLAFAMPAATLAEWTRAFGELGTVDAVVTLPWACARSGARGAMAVDGGLAEHGLIVVRDGVVKEARRIAAGTPDAVDAPRAGAANESGATALDVRATLRAASDAADVSLHEQLLDDETSTRIERRRRGRVLRSVAMCAAALIALAWSADRWRARTYEALRAETTRLTGDAEPARVALLRMQRAEAEAALLARADSVAELGNRPAAVLARLGAVLPRDAFVQRLDWDGAAWRLDGSALDAPRIVPLLDADPTFADVRILAASTRFLEGGRQRESFSIAFTAQARPSVTAAATAGGSRGAR